MSDPRWAGRRFGIEPLRGVRRWQMSHSGVLFSAYRPYAWAGGENVAECERRDRAVLARSGYKHDVASCSCGFHALTDLSRQEIYGRSYGDVVGLIEGYGEVVEGTEGFRATRGRIVALVVPQGRPSWRRQLRDPIVRDVIFDGALVPIALAMGLALHGLGRLLWFVAAMFWVYLTAKAFGRLVARRPARRQVPPTARRELIAPHYPGVQFYDTIEAMLAAHPSSPPAPAPPRVGLDALGKQLAAFGRAGIPVATFGQTTPQPLTPEQIRRWLDLEQ